MTTKPFIVVENGSNILGPINITLECSMVLNNFYVSHDLSINFIFIEKTTKFRTILVYFNFILGIHI